MCLARGVRYGQLITGLEAAHEALRLASRAADLLDPEARASLRQACGELHGIEQRAWEALEQEKETKR